MRKKSHFELDKNAQAAINNALEELLEQCRIYKVPMFASVVFGNTETTTKYNNVTYNAASHNIGLADDQIRKHILVADGFDVVPQRQTLTIDPNDFLSEDEITEDNGNG